ncbi:hypothetical protein BJ508DRAFT_308078 [Ascobolus immersus RN42]|uniref:Uncharacterized protein n=1 Tax=Ascobolus immersus RN42 TaxID=1160509 RepID=A0A3N4I1A4_ASCIM|nr:hypothetical protein BJ508DRAFT_308078 [Ascobolus immersus RN42]
MSASDLLIGPGEIVNLVDVPPAAAVCCEESGPAFVEEASWVWEGGEVGVAGGAAGCLVVVDGWLGVEDGGWCSFEFWSDACSCSDIAHKRPPKEKPRSMSQDYEYSDHDIDIELEIVDSEPEQHIRYYRLRYEVSPMIVKIPFCTSIHQATAAAIPTSTSYAFKTFEVHFSISFIDTVVLTVYTLHRDVIICHDIERGTEMAPLAVLDLVTLLGIRCSLALGLKVKAICETRRGFSSNFGIEHYFIRHVYTEEFDV